MSFSVGPNHQLVEKIVNERPVTHFCCQKEAKSPLIGLWLAVGTVAVVMMNYYDYKLKDVIAAQRKARVESKEVQPKKSRSNFLFWSGLGLLLVLVWFTFMMFRCPKYVVEDKGLGDRAKLLAWDAAGGAWGGAKAGAKGMWGRAKKMFRA